VTAARVLVCCNQNMLVSLSSDKSSEWALKVVLFNTDHHRQNWTQKLM